VPLNVRIGMQKIVFIFIEYCCWRRHLKLIGDVYVASHRLDWWNLQWLVYYLSFLAFSMNMLALRLSISWCVPKQWQNSHLGDISIQTYSLSLPLSWIMDFHDITADFSFSSNLLSNQMQSSPIISRIWSPTPSYTINRRWSCSWNRSLVHTFTSFYMVNGT